MLTNEGKSVLQYANRFREIEDEFISSIKNKDGITGELKIFAPNTICVYHLPKLLTEFRSKHSQVNFKLRAHLGTKDLEELRSGNIDLMIVMEEEYNNPDFNITSLRAEEISFICHNNHPQSNQTNLELRDLINENFILTEPTCGYRTIITREFLRLGTKLAPVMWFDNAEAIKECVKSNMGISFIPKIAAEQDITDGKFTQINLVQKFENQIKLQLITLKDKWLSPALDEFTKALADKIGGGNESIPAYNAQQKHNCKCVSILYIKLYFGKLYLATSSTVGVKWNIRLQETQYPAVHRCERKFLPLTNVPSPMVFPAKNATRIRLNSLQANLKISESETGTFSELSLPT